MTVELTLLEFDLAQHVACQRNRDGIRARADSGKFGNAADTLALHLRGCLFELAFAKAKNRYWTGAGAGFHDDDDVANVQIRGTEHDDGCLLVRPDEGHSNEPWVLVTGAFPRFTIRGWIWGHEAKQEHFLRSPANRPPAYFVPQSSLRSLT